MLTTGLWQFFFCQFLDELHQRGYVLYDRAEATVAWVREVPSPARAAELLAEHGVRWEEELLSHSLSPVPQEAEGHR